MINDAILINRLHQRFVAYEDLAKAPTCLCGRKRAVYFDLRQQVGRCVWCTLAVGSGGVLVPRHEQGGESKQAEIRKRREEWKATL